MQPFVDWMIQGRTRRGGGGHESSEEVGERKRFKTSWGSRVVHSHHGSWKERIKKRVRN